jgi:hypothetical protein
MRVSGGHLDRSDAFIDPVLLLSYPLLDIVRTLRPQVDFLKGRNASFPPNQLRCGYSSCCLAVGIVVELKRQYHSEPAEVTEALE